jgi:hypothetical protein
MWFETGSRYRIEEGGDPSGKTPIAGPARVDAADLEHYAARRRLRIGQDGAKAYVAIGGEYGIRGDIAFCQAIYETRWLSANRMVPLAANLLPDLWSLKGRDELWTERFIEEHIRLLYCFSKEAELPARRTPDDENSSARAQTIEELGYRGKVRFWEELSGKWSYFGVHYGQDVVAIWRSLEIWAGIRKERMERDKEKPAELASPV